MNHHVEMNPQSPYAIPGAIQTAAGVAMSVARLDIKQGAVTQPHRHAKECVIIVLQGACSFRIGQRATTLTENQVLRIPAGEEHFAEAATDTVALAISTEEGNWSGCGPFMRDDPDQYLWGV